MGVVQNSIDIEKSLAEVMALAAQIGDETSGIVKDIDDLQEANAKIMTSVSANSIAIQGLTQEKAIEITPYSSRVSISDISMNKVIGKTAFVAFKFKELQATSGNAARLIDFSNLQHSSATALYISAYNETKAAPCELELVNDNNNICLKALSAIALNDIVSVTFITISE